MMKNLMGRLLLVIVLALLPAVGFEIYIEAQARQIRAALINEEGLRLAHLVNAEMQTIVESSEQVLRALAVSASILDQNLTNCHRLLAEVVRQSPCYTSAGVFDPKGHVVCSAQQGKPDVDVSDRLYFRQALETGGFVLDGYPVGPATSRPSMHVAIPLKAPDGAIAGVVTLALDLAWLNNTSGPDP